MSPGTLLASSLRSNRSAVKSRYGGQTAGRGCVRQCAHHSRVRIVVVGTSPAASRPVALPTLRANFEPVAAARPIGYIIAQAPVAQLDRALPSEGKGHTFESCRVRQHDA